MRRLRVEDTGVDPEAFSKARVAISALRAERVSLQRDHIREYDLDVKRVFSDMTPPTAQEQSRYQPRLDHADGQPIVDFIWALVSDRAIEVELGSGQHEVRRVQVNELATGDFIGEHDDTSANDDYTHTLVIGLSQNYDGGELVVTESGTEYAVQPKLGEIVIFDSRLRHSIRQVISGTRATLVAFVR